MRLATLMKSLKESLSLSWRYLRRSEPRYKSMVEKYPDTISGKAPVDMFSSFRGYLRNDLTKCTGCAACVPVCPVKALDFKAETRVDGSISVQEFSINLGKCFSCGACIDVCPEASLSYSRDFELVSDRPAGLMMVLYGHAVKNEKDITRIRTYEVRR